MLSQITDAIWMIEVGDELHWDDCKKIGTMDEWNKAIEHFNNRHNEDGFLSLFTDDNHIVEKLRIVYSSDEEEEEEEEEQLCRNCDSTYMGRKDPFCIMGHKNCGNGLPHITEVFPHIYLNDSVK